MKTRTTPLTFVPPRRSAPIVPATFFYTAMLKADHDAVELEEAKAMLKQVSAAKKEFRHGEARTFSPIP